VQKTSMDPLEARLLETDSVAFRTSTESKLASLTEDVRELSQSLQDLRRWQNLVRFDVYGIIVGVCAIIVISALAYAFVVWVEKPATDGPNNRLCSEELTQRKTNQRRMRALILVNPDGTTSKLPMNTCVTTMEVVEAMNK